MFILTSRFNNETLKANYDYREKLGIPCIYACPCKISRYVDLGVNCSVIEMNNSTNNIVGIGFIKNKIDYNKYYNIHYDRNYNRYIYKGYAFISREKLIEYNTEFIELLEKLLFKGKSHSKRGMGLTLMPKKLLIYIDKDGEMERHNNSDYVKKNDRIINIVEEINKINKLLLDSKILK